MNAADKEKDQVVSEIAGHARFLFDSRRYLCTEAVLIALNQDLGGNLTENQAVALAAPFGWNNQAAALMLNGSHQS